MLRSVTLIVALTATALVGETLAQTPAVVSVSPPQNALDIDPTTNVLAVFDMEMNTATIDTLSYLISGNRTGPHLGVISYESGSQTVTFDASRDFQVGETVTVILSADVLSSDGTPLANGYTWSFTAAANDGQGTFAAQVDYLSGDRSQYVTTADLSGDDLVDVISISGGGTLSVLTNNGGTSLNPPNDYQTAGTEYIVAGDFDGDYDIDIATIDFDTDNVCVLLNAGDGSLGSVSTYTVGDGPVTMSCGDINGDGLLDLVVAYNATGLVSTLFGAGDGSFAIDSSYSVGTGRGAICLADLDADGDMDIATANETSNDVSVLLNEGDGVFGAQSRYALVGGERPLSIFAADLDGDGDIDIATGNCTSGNVSILTNDGNALLEAGGTLGAGLCCYTVRGGDLDSDGDVDLVATNTSSNDVSVFLNNGDATFVSAARLPVGKGPYAVSVADLDGDGSLDLVTGSHFSDSVSLLLNQPATSIDELDRTPLPDEFRLLQNCPNPFNPATEMNFALPIRADVRLEVFNILGRRVETLADRPFNAGYHTVVWDASPVASGVYFYRLTAGEFVETKKMVLLK